MQVKIIQKTSDTQEAPLEMEGSQSLLSLDHSPLTHHQSLKHKSRLISQTLSM